MKTILVLFVLTTILLCPSQAQDEPTVAEIYADEISQLEQLLNEFNETEASQKHPMVSTFASALLQLMSSNQDCYRVDHSAIASLALTLAQLTDSLSYPCEDEAAYQAAKDIDRLARSIRDKADRQVFLSSLPPGIDPETVALIETDGSTPSCSVSLFYYGVNEIKVGQELWNFSVAATGGRFAELGFAAIASPSGGQFAFSITESGGHPLVEEYPPSTRLIGDGISTPKQEILRAQYRLKRPTPAGYYLIVVSVTYFAPNGATCHDTGTMVIKP